MANEANIRSSLQIQTGYLDYQSRPTEFQATVTGQAGPTPGSVLVATQAGTNIDLSTLVQPGLCRLMNLDAINFVEYGIYDPELLIFYPLGELLPGETFIFRFSRNLAQEYGSTGTGTVGLETNRFHMRADTAACYVLVEAFET